VRFKIYGATIDKPDGVNGYIFTKELLDGVMDTINNTGPWVVELSNQPSTQEECDIEKMCAIVEKGSAKMEDGTITYIVKSINTCHGAIFEELDCMTVGGLYFGEVNDDGVVQKGNIGKFVVTNADLVGFKYKERLDD
jgi:hypothetical protein